MKISVLDRDAIGKDIDISGFEKFGNVTVHDRTVAADAVKNIGDADIAVTNKVRLSAEILAAAPNLKFIAEAATGVDNIDTAFCLEHGIGVANVPAYSTSSVAQVTVSLACMMMTKLDVFCDFCRSGEYTAAGLPNRPRRSGPFCSAGNGTAPPGPPCSAGREITGATAWPPPGCSFSGASPSAPS